ncbi:MAG: ribonuclease J [Chloroflexi bacterium]|nr:MAG: ribonuclease J [Chloroflexota bacterium]
MPSTLRIIPLGGLGEIGKNMIAIEYKNDIIVIDAGLMFPESDMLGINAILPDYSYLKDKRDKVRALLLTHGHEDHVGAIPHFLEDINVPVYGTKLTIGLVEVKLREAKLLKNAQLNIIQSGDKFQIGPFKIEPFHVTHSIPDCVGFGITTPVGLIVHTGDYKFDHTPPYGEPPDFAKLAEFSKRGVLCLLADSTNATRPGWTKSEKRVGEAFEDVFREAKGRIIVATFASLISRVQQVAEMAQKYGRKLAITGRSMRDNTKMARRLGFLNIPDDLLIDIEQVSNLPPHKVVVMATGSQGEPTAVMGRLARGRHHRLRVQEGDTIVFSAYPIPGNEESVYRIINMLFRRGANVLYEGVANVHVSGHASQEEMKLMINLVRPKFLVPVHGELRHLKEHARLAMDMGIPEKNIAVVENGTPLELTRHSLEIKPRLPGGYVFVDGTEVGEVVWSVMREREELAQSGFFMALVGLSKKGNLSGTPEFVSRGFVDMKRADELLEGAKETIANVISMHGRNPDKLEKKLEDALSRYLYGETGKRPFVKVVLK